MTKDRKTEYLSCGIYVLFLNHMINAYQTPLCIGRLISGKGGALKRVGFKRRFRLHKSRGPISRESYLGRDGKGSSGGTTTIAAGFSFTHRSMAQARVTDYFAQGKKGTVGRSFRSKGQKVSADVAESAAIVKPKTSCRATRSSRNAPRPPASPEPQRCVQKEFLKVIDEALSSEAADPVTDARDERHAALTASPRTPKRGSEEFDVCSVLFASTAELHSSAKKRQRLHTDQKREPADKTSTKSARKKLDLLGKDSKERVNMINMFCYKYLF